MGNRALGETFARAYGAWLIRLGIVLTATGSIQGGAEDVFRKEISNGVIATVKHGRTLGLEVRPPAGNAARRFLESYLSDPDAWVAYRDRNSAFININDLKPSLQRNVLLAIYSEDLIDSEGWTHVVLDPRETLWSLCEWITGNGANYEAVMRHPTNGIRSAALKKGQRIFIPAKLLNDAMREQNVAQAPIIPAENPFKGILDYREDRSGKYAEYTLGKGEALYTSVVVRFTDYRENADIVEACREIAARSRIADVRDIAAGHKIQIPLEMLSPAFLPEGHENRRDYDEVLREAVKLRSTGARSSDLSDVVVILDPGHGGRDYGTAKPPIYEDEVNYDIVCRIKLLLERETGARVYVTMRDKSQGYTPSEAKSFVHDQDEELTTSPPYPNTEDSSVSVNLRWMLANAIYQQELKRGTDSRKVVFTSIHTDSLFNSALRGLMIYIPGAQYRREEEVRTAAVYARYEEGRDFNHFSSTSSERVRDEAISRNFAETLLAEFGRKNVKRHDQSDPIRGQIRQSQNRVYVPAVIRNTKVPTKVLIETANINNPTDRERLRDPAWRQAVAEAYVDALRRNFGAATGTKQARSGG